MSILAGVNLTSSDGAEAKHQVGARFNGRFGTYMYCKATAASIAAYSACSGATPGVVEEATTTTATALGTAGGFCAIPQFDVAASEYFWAPVGPFTYAEDGVTNIKVLAANAAGGAALLTTATDGVLDDASGSGQIPLIGLVLNSTVSTQAATACTAFKTLSWTK